MRPKLRIPTTEAEARQLVTVVYAVDTTPGGGITWPERRLILVIRHVIAQRWPHLIDPDPPGGETRAATGR